MNFSRIDAITFGSWESRGNSKGKEDYSHFLHGLPVQNFKIWKTWRLLIQQNLSQIQKRLRKNLTSVNKILCGWRVGGRNIENFLKFWKPCPSFPRNLGNQTEPRIQNRDNLIKTATFKTSQRSRKIQNPSILNKNR